LALTVAGFGVAIFVPLFVIPALFLSALLVRILRFPWQWVLMLALVLLGLTAIAPSFGSQELSDGLGVAAYAVAVVACSAGLIEALGERRTSRGRSDSGPHQSQAATLIPQGSSEPDGPSESDEPGRAVGD
jgi:hypothetical protein